MSTSKPIVRRLHEVLSETKDTPLVLVSLADTCEKYGYVREIGTDFFILEEVVVITDDKIDCNPKNRRVEKTGRIKIHLENLLGWATLSPVSLTSQSQVVLLDRYKAC